MLRFSHCFWQKGAMTMALRPSASGTITFGLVSIPIKVYSATSSKSVSFNMLHASDKSRLKRQMVCSTCGEIVAGRDTVRGYQYARDQYVVMTPDEIKALEQHSDQSIEIHEFIPIEQIDPVFFAGATLLGPDRAGNKPYRLLKDAMLESGKVAIGRFSTRGKQQLVLIRPTPRGLMMHGLFYADEVRGFEEVEMGDEVEPRENELELAQQLIEQLSKKTFDAGRYEDEYRQKVLAAVEQKVAGEDVVIQPKEEAKEQIIDLVAALKASIASKKVGEDEAETAPVKTAAKRSRKAAQAKGQAKAARKRTASKRAAR